MMPIAAMRIRQNAAAPPATFPVIASFQNTGTVESSFIAATMPSGYAAGDLLIAFLGTSSVSAVTAPSGWVKISDVSDSDGSGLRQSIFTKIATGSEGASVEFSAAGFVRIRALVLRVQGASGAVELVSSFIFNQSSPSSPALAPSWGAKQTLWISFAFGSEPAAPTSYPLPNNQNYFNQNVARPYFYLSSVPDAVSSKTPGALVMPIGQYGAIYTIAVEPI